MSLRKRKSVESIWRIQEALGGERRGWHPRFYMNDITTDSAETLDERPESVEDWGRPELESSTKQIGDAIESYLEENYWMDNVDDGAVDLIVEEGAFEDALVQAKGAVVKATQGDDGKGRMYSRPGGFYLREDRMKELSEADEDAILYTVVHYPRRELPEDLEVPLVSINDDVDSALVGEFAFPAEEVYRSTDFDRDGKKYWDWDKAYGERPNTSSVVERWHQDSFLEKI